MFITTDKEIPDEMRRCDDNKASLGQENPIPEPTLVEFPETTCEICEANIPARMVTTRQFSSLKKVPQRCDSCARIIESGKRERECIGQNCRKRFNFSEEECKIYINAGHQLSSYCPMCRRSLSEFRRIPALESFHADLIKESIERTAHQNAEIRSSFTKHACFWFGLLLVQLYAVGILSWFNLPSPIAVVFNGYEAVQHGPWTDYEESYDYIYANGQDPLFWKILAIVVGAVITWKVVPLIYAFYERFVLPLQVKLEIIFRKSFVAFGPFISFIANRIIFLIGFVLVLVANIAPFWLVGVVIHG